MGTGYVWNFDMDTGIFEKSTPDLAKNGLEISKNRHWIADCPFHFPIMGHHCCQPSPRPSEV